MNKMAAFFYTAWLAREIYPRFLVNKHGDLYFLLKNFAVQMVLFELDKPLLEDAHYDLENNDPRNVLIRH